MTRRVVTTRHGATMGCDRTVTLGATIVAMATSSRTGAVACDVTIAEATATEDIVTAAVATVGGSVIAVRSGIITVESNSAVDLTTGKAGVRASLAREYVKWRCRQFSL